MANRTFGERQTDFNNEVPTEATVAIAYVDFVEDEYMGKTKEKVCIGFTPTSFPDNSDTKAFRQQTKTGSLWEWYNLGQTRDCQFAVFIMDLLKKAKKAKVDIPGMSVEGDDLKIVDMNALAESLLGLQLDIEKDNMICGSMVAKNKWVVTKVHGYIVEDDLGDLGPKEVPRNHPKPTESNALAVTDATRKLKPKPREEATEAAEAEAPAPSKSKTKAKGKAKSNAIPAEWSNMDEAEKRLVVRTAKNEGPAAVIDLLVDEHDFSQGGAESVVEYVQQEYNLGG